MSFWTKKVFENSLDFFSSRHLHNVSSIALRTWSDVVVLNFLKRDCLNVFMWDVNFSKKNKRSNNRSRMIVSLNLTHWESAISICEYTSIRLICLWYVKEHFSFELVSRSLFFYFLFFFWLEFFFLRHSLSFSNWNYFSIRSRSWQFEVDLIQRRD